MATISEGDAKQVLKGLQNLNERLRTPSCYYYTQCVYIEAMNNSLARREADLNLANDTQATLNRVLALNAISLTLQVITPVRVALEVREPGQ